MLTYEGPVGVDGEVPSGSEEDLREKPVEAVDVKPHPHIHLRLRQGRGGRAPRHLALLIFGARGVLVAPSGCFFFFVVVVLVLHSSTTRVLGAPSVFFFLFVVVFVFLFSLRFGEQFAWCSVVRRTAVSISCSASCPDSVYPTCSMPDRA